MRRFIIIITFLFLRDNFSPHVNIDMILILDYILMTNIKKRQLVQRIFMVIGLYQVIQIQCLLFLFVLI